MKKYNFHVLWSAEDNEYVATTDNYPSLSWLHSDPSRALAGLIVLLLKEEELDAAESTEEAKTT